MWCHFRIKTCQKWHDHAEGSFELWQIILTLFYVVKSSYFRSFFSKFWKRRINILNRTDEKLKYDTTWLNSL